MGRARASRRSVPGGLGEGTFGTVVKATHAIAGERVAVKVLEKKGGGSLTKANGGGEAKRFRGDIWICS